MGDSARKGAGSLFISRSAVFLVLALCQPSGLFAQTVSLANRTQAAVQAQEAPKNVGVPKPAGEPTTGTWKYKLTDVVPQGNARGTHVSDFSVTVKDNGGVWTVTTAWKSDQGPVTDVSSYEKGTLILRKELFDHFLHQDQPWKPVAIYLDFAGDKVTGTMKYVSGKDKPVAMDLGGHVFAAANPEVMIGCLPLADGYSTTFRYFEVDRVPIDPPAAEKLMQLKVAGMERVTVPAGTFDAYKVELTSADVSYKETVWIAKDSRIPVKTYGVEVYRKGSMITTAELVP